MVGGGTDFEWVQWWVLGLWEASVLLLIGRKECVGVSGKSRRARSCAWRRPHIPATIYPGAALFLQGHPRCFIVGHLLKSACVLEYKCLTLRWAGGSHLVLENGRWSIRGASWWPSSYLCPFGWQSFLMPHFWMQFYGVKLLKSLHWALYRY